MPWKRAAAGSLVILTVSSAAGAAPAFDSSVANSLIQLPGRFAFAHPFRISDEGSLDFDKAHWIFEKDPEGTALLKAKTKSESRVAATKTADGAIESLSYYHLSAPAKAKTVPHPAEHARVMFFNERRLSAFTDCTDSGAKDSLGRICVTATPQLCSALKAGSGVTPDILKQTETFEMRALAMVLTLRGSDHQLDNVVRSGNRLGLKSGLQTTKGQLLALARQIAKEQNAAAREPGAKAPASVSAEAKKPTEPDSAVTRAVLEESLPRLKQACSDTKFATATETAKN